MCGRTLNILINLILVPVGSWVLILLAVVVAENKDAVISNGTEATKESETSNGIEPSKESEVEKDDDASKEAEFTNQAVVTNECETKESVKSTEENSGESFDKPGTSQSFDFFLNSNSN